MTLSQLRIEIAERLKWDTRKPAPNWPADDAAAASLLQDADRRGWYVVLDNDAGYEGDEGDLLVWNCCIAAECCLEVKTPAEAISRAWLKAMEAQE